MSPTHRLRLVSLSALSFLLMTSYALARPAAESLFLDAHGSESLPRVWLLVAGVMAAAVWIYGRLVRRLELVRLYGGAALLAAALAVALLVAVAARVPLSTYALYAWKDVYIVVLVEIFYSYGNAVFDIGQARRAYGLFGFVGALAGLGTGLLAGPLAALLGTVGVLWIVPGLLVLSWVVSLPLAHRAGAHRPPDQAPAAGALQVISRSPYLVLVLALIALVQVTITLVDYQFNSIVEQAFPDKDVRTGVVGQVYAAVNGGTILLHALTAPALRLAGVPAILLSVPGVLAAGLGAFVAGPRFLTIAVLKVGSKVFDYTWFRAAKEILYIPLSFDEKTAGKSVVDMLTYRVAKAGASLLLMGLLALGLAGQVSAVTAALLLAWVAVTVPIVRRFRARVSRQDEVRGG